MSPHAHSRSEVDVECTRDRLSRLKLTDSDGGQYVWHFRRERSVKVHYGILETHDAAVRVLEPMWAASAPGIRQIAENYGLVPDETVS